MKVPFKWLLAIILCMCSFPTGSYTYAATLHTLIVVDTTDISVGSLIAQNEPLLINLATDAAEATGLELNLQVVDGLACRSEDIFAALASLRVKPDDAILFYYSGHGFRTPNKIESEWPNLYLSMEGTGIKLDTIVDKLSKKKPRLLIAATECCNSFVEDGMIPIIEKKVFNRAQANTKRDNYIKLFQKASGLVVITSSKPGQFSYVNWEGGGFMTRSFFEVMNDYLNRQGANWNQILEATKRKTFEFGKQFFNIEQEPIYKVNIQYK